MKTLEKIRDDIRNRFPGRPMGDHWQGVGVYIAEGVWGDPCEYWYLADEYGNLN